MRTDTKILRELELTMSRRGRWIRWLWRYNAVVIALAGTLAVILLAVSIIGQIMMASQYARHDRGAAASISARNDQPLQRRFQSHHPGTTWILAELTSPGGFGGSSDNDVVRNIVAYDLVSGQGRALFESNAGAILRYVLVDSECAQIVPWEDERPDTPPAALIGLYGLPGEEHWRLGMALLPGGEWREIRAGIDSLDVFSGVAPGACTIMIGEGDRESLLRFPLRGDLAVEHIPLTAPALPR